MTSAASSNTTSAASGAASGSQEILERAGQLRARLGTGFRDEVVQSLYAEAERVAQRAVSSAGGGRWDLDQRIDRMSHPRSSACRSCCSCWPPCSG
jgi:hypothetical protein